MCQDISRELVTLRAERSSATQARAKLTCILLEVLKGRKDILARAAPSVLALQNRMAERERSFECELLRIMEKGNAREANHFARVEAL
jgi:hypothetical protein